MADALAELVGALAEARRRQGITQAAVGAALGLTDVSIANWEGDRVPSAGNFVLWAEALSQRLVVADADDAVLSVARPVPQRGGEEVHLYRLRVLTVTLRDVRPAADLTQHQVGDQLGVSGWAVQMWENSRRVPRLPRLLEWCGVLDCHLDLKRS